MSPPSPSRARRAHPCAVPAARGCACSWRRVHAAAESIDLREDEVAAGSTWGGLLPRSRTGPQRRSAYPAGHATSRAACSWQPAAPHHVWPTMGREGPAGMGGASGWEARGGGRRDGREGEGAPDIYYV